MPNILPETRVRALELVATGKRGAAVKLVRRATGVGSKEAKEYVDGLKAEVLARSVPAEVEARAVSLIARGKWIDAAKEVRESSPLGLKDAKDYVDGLRSGALRTRGEGSDLSARARALKATDHESAIALVQTETGMRREEAECFIAALVE
jgi:ribosomal protein L7/L12